MMSRGAAVPRRVSLTAQARAYKARVVAYSAEGSPLCESVRPATAVAPPKKKTIFEVAAQHGPDRKRCAGGAFKGHGEVYSSTEEDYSTSPFVIPYWHESVAVLAKPVLRLGCAGTSDPDAAAATHYEDRPDALLLQRPHLDAYFAHDIAAQAVASLRAAAAAAAAAAAPRPLTFVDCGANVGFFTLRFLAEVRRRLRGEKGGASAGEAEVPVRGFCLEPLPASATVLRLNLEGLPAADRPHVLPCAAGEQPGFARISVHRGSSPTAGLKPQEAVSNDKGMGAVDDAVCEVRTLTDIMGLHSIDAVDLLKIDVEGSELDVLRGLSDEAFARVATVVVEVHTNVDPARVSAVTALLSEHGLIHSHATTSVAEDVPLTLVWASRLPW